MGVHAPVVYLGDDRAAYRVGDEPGFAAAFGGLGRDGVRHTLTSVPVGDGAEVPAFQGMLFKPFPYFVFELDPVPFRDALLNPADQNGGGVDAFDLGGLVGGE